VDYYLEELTKAVRKKHGQEAEHMQTVVVKETIEGTNVWDGAVEVFSLRWNPKAKRCYAWGRPRDDGGWDITTVLQVRPVISAYTAVNAAATATVELTQPKASRASA
jgi:hypothetical protein